MSRKIERLFVNGVEEFDKNKCSAFISKNYSKIKRSAYERKTQALYIEI